MAKNREADDNRKDDSGCGELYRSNVVRTAYVDGNTFYATAVQYAEVDGLAMFEGDIILGTVDEVRRISDFHQKEMRGEIAQGAVITGSQYRWPDCTVPYTIDSTLPNQTRVTDAIAHWEANTCFRFVLRTAANAAQHHDWVNFQPGSGCSSYVGRRGGQQAINLASGCDTGNTIHEIGHTIGLWHEQSRADRDSFVTIHWDKIQPGFEHNFNQHITDGDDVGTYDYGSIMHYPRNAFSIDGSDTITPINPPTAVIGQRTALSPGDIAAANSLCPSVPFCPALPLCPAAPKPCPPAPFCPPAPKPCPPAPWICPVGPKPCPPAPFCPPAPKPCPPAPWICPVGPKQCLAAPFCPPAPKPCPAAPWICPVGPKQCPAAPFCAPAPKSCLPAPLQCIPAPKIVCAPAPKMGCFPAPIAGCMAGPYMQPGPRTNPPSFGYAPYGYGTAGECWPGYEYVGPYGYYADPYGYYAHPYAYYGDPYGYYAHPYGYGASGEDWTAYEYVNPYARYPSQGYYAPYASFDPRYYW